MQGVLEARELQVYIEYLSRGSLRKRHLCKGLKNMIWKTTVPS